jgi:hypothetical protein
MEAHQQIKDKIIHSSSMLCYGKYLNPMETSFSYSVNDLISYLNFADSLCEDIVEKFQKLLAMKSTYHIVYGERTKNTRDLVKRTAEKIRNLESRLRRIEHEVEEENIDEFIDELFEAQEKGKVIELTHPSLTAPKKKFIDDKSGFKATTKYSS